jgi:hypothetical protein
VCQCETEARVCQRKSSYTADASVGLVPVDEGMVGVSSVCVTALPSVLTVAYLGGIAQLAVAVVGFGAVLNTYFGLQRFEPITPPGGTWPRTHCPTRVPDGCGFSPNSTSGRALATTTMPEQTSAVSTTMGPGVVGTRLLHHLPHYQPTRPCTMLGSLPDIDISAPVETFSRC